MMFLFGSIALAGPNWLPLPQFFGLDISPSQTAWQPTAQVSCSALTVAMQAPTEDQSLIDEVFLIETFNGFEEYYTGRVLAMDTVKWYVTGLYDFDGNLISTNINSPELLMDFVPGQDEGTTEMRNFTIDTPLRPGQRVYLETYYEVSGRIYDQTDGEDPDDPTSTYEPWSKTNINNKDTIGDSEYPDRYIRVYDRAFSAEDATNNAREYACSDNSAAPTLQMSLEGGLDQNEGDTTRDLSYSLNLVDGNGNPTTTTQDVWAYVEVDVVTDDPRLGDYDRPMWTGDSTINGVGDFTVFDNSSGTPVEMQDTENIAVRYVHVNNSDQCGGSYCDVIPSNPAETVRVYIPAGQNNGDFTLRIFGDIKPETDERLRFELLGASHAKMPTERTQALLLRDDDQPLVSIDDVTGSLCSVPEGSSKTFMFPVSIPEVIEGQVELEYTTTTSGTSLIEFLEYTPIPADPQDIYSARGDYTDLPSGTTTTTAEIDILRNAEYRGSNFNAVGDTLVMNLDRWQDIEIGRGGDEFYVPAGVRFRDGDMSATLTILPWGPEVSVSDATLIEGDDGQQFIEFTLTLAEAAVENGDIPQDITVAYRTVDGTAIAGQDYVATNGTVTLGAVPNDPNPPAFEQTTTVQIPIIGDELVENNETFTLELIHEDSSGICVSETAGAATGTITDDDPPTLTVNDVSASEADGTLAFTFMLDAASGRDISVGYTTTGISATADEDFTATSGTLNFTNGETEQTVEVPLNDDNIWEDGDETFTLDLSSSSDVILAVTSVTGTITDDEGVPVLTVEDATTVENDGSIVFDLSLSNPSATATTWEYITNDGTAIAGEDYTFTRDSVTIPALATTAQVSVPVLDDDLYEPDETFTLVFPGDINDLFRVDAAAQLTDISAIGIITDDDTAISITAASANEAAGQMIFTVTRSGVAQAVTFDYATTDGTAIAGTHYTATAGNASIAANATATTINVPIIDDNVANVDRTFTLSLSNASGAGITQDSATGTIINDDALSDVPTQLTQTGATDVAPLELIFGWQHQAAIGVDDVAGDWYNVVIYQGAQVFVDEWRQASTICTGITCELTLVDDYPYDLLDGNYEWLVQASIGDDILTSAPQALTINMGVPAAPMIADASYGGGDLTVNFNSDPAATWYNVLVEDSSSTVVLSVWLEKSAICTAATCTSVEGLGVASGTYSVEVGAWGPNSTGLGTRSAPTSLTISGTAPALLTGLSVINETYGQPLFTWNADPAASYYRVWIGTADYTRTSYFQWNSAASLSCSSGTCTLDPMLNLIGGTYTWFAQAWGPGGYNDNDISGWVQGPNFTVTSTAPGLVSGLSVTEADTGSPTITWAEDPAATWYQLWMGLADGSSTAFYGWTSAAELNCTSGTCIFAPDVALANGSYAIYAQAWGPGGFNADDQNGWAGTDFAVGAPAPTAPTLIAPASNAIVPGVPEFRWNAVSGATWYHLEVVQQPTATRASATIDLWMNAADFGCEDNVCELIPTTPLATGGYEWRVQAYSPAGLGTWSPVEAFSVN
jgi:hypothetical protein